MTDIFTPEKRSQVMSKIKSKNNSSTELKLIQIFKSLHIIGWRRNYKLIGSPDFVFQKKKIAIFADGCFWHGHNCRNLIPSSNISFWENKIAKNIKHDKKVVKELTKKGWLVYRFWECEINNRELIENKLIEIFKS